MLYIQDRQNKTLGVVSDYYNDTHQMILSSGLSSYTFTIAKNIKDVEHLIEGNYVVVTDDSGIGWKFTIMNTTQTHSEITLYCEDIGLELINKVMDSWVAPSTKQPVSYYINKAIKDTQWEIGINEIEDLSRTLLWEGRDTSLNRLLSIATQFDNSEIEFRVRFKNLQVTDYLINIYKKRGADRSDIQLVYGDTVNDITKTSSIEGLATALMGVGSDKELPENSPAGAIADKTTFKDLTYDDGLFFTKAGDKFLRARVANQQFNLKEGYIEDFYEYDTADPQELLNRTITQLKERSEIKVNYEVSVAKFEKTLQLGDTITIIDHDYKPELLLSGRVLEMDKSYTDPSKNTLVLGNFLILYSNINDRLTNLQNQIKNMKVDSNYMWLRYAIDDKGTEMSATPTAETKYFAMLVNKKTGVPSDNPADYTGHWKLIQGEDGKDGVAGEKGADGKTSYTHFAYANDVSGHSDFSLDDPTGRAYMGVFSDFTKADSTNPDDYIWSLTKGEDGEQGIQGLQGPQGAKGIAGPKGADGKTQYTHIAYANSADGKTDFSQTPANHKYIGMYVDFIEDDSNDPTKYGWSLIKGEDGLDGAQGIAGKPGADGKTSYTHIAYADTVTGSGFSQSPNNKKYIGMYVDFTENDSGDPMKYAWSLIKGDDGKDGIAGKDGVGIKSTQIMYAQSTSGTTVPTAGWTAQVPTLIKGQYLWTQTTWLYTDNTGEAGYTVSYNAKDGNTGSDGRAGKDGVGIKSTTITYASSTSGTSAPTSGWVSTPPSATAGQFIWTRTIWTYTDNTTETGYSVGKIGEKGADGANGIPGKPGADGRTPYLHIAYANIIQIATEGTSFTLSERAVVRFGKDDNWVYKTFDAGTYTANNATFGRDPYQGASKVAEVVSDFSVEQSANKIYVGFCTDFTQSDSTDPASYSWSLVKGDKGKDGTNGTPGKAGADGKTPYFHTAWADSKDGKINFNLSDATNRGYLGTYTDFTKADSTDSTKYIWTELVGNILTGAPNLIKNTGNFKNDEHWQHSGTLTFTESHPFWKNGTEPLFKLRTTGTAEVTLSSDRFPLIRNAEYTVQFDGFHNDNISSVDVWILSRKYGSSAGFDRIQLIKGAFRLSTSDIVHTTIKFTAPSDMDEAYLRLDNNGSKTAGQVADLWLTDIKVAHENRPSPWSPSPEDAQEQIDSVNQALVQANNKINEVPHVSAQASAPTSPKKGDQWWVLDASGKATGFKVWNGTAWNDSKIQQSLLNVVSLNAVTITGSTINGSKFTNNFDFTGLDKVHFQGVTTIANGSMDITWKIPENNQTGETKVSASGFDSTIRNSKGAIMRAANLTMGELSLSNGTVTGWLNEQDVYQNYTNQVQYLDGWYGWNNPISITRRGKMVTFSGYIAHNGGSAHINIAQFPAWARPEHTEFIVEIHFGGDTGTRTNGYGNLMLSTGGRLIVNRGLDTGQHASFGYTFVGQDI